MKLSCQIRPISYIKANISKIINKLGEYPGPLIITQNGEARAVMQDIHSYEQQQETMALLKLLTLGNRQVEAGRTCSAADAFSRVRQRRQGNI